MENPSVKQTDSQLLRRRKADRTLRKIALISVSLLAGLLAGLIVVLVVFVFNHPKTTEFFNNPFPTDRYEYHHGDKVQYLLEYHKYADVLPEVHRQLVCDTPGEGKYYYVADPVLLDIPKTPDDVPTQKALIVSFVIPDDAPLNQNCYIHLNGKYRFNILKIENTYVRTQDFKIVANNVPRRKTDPIKPSQDFPLAPNDPEGIDLGKPLEGIPVEKKPFNEQGDCLDVTFIHLCL